MSNPNHPEGQGENHTPYTPAFNHIPPADLTEATPEAIVEAANAEVVDPSLTEISEESLPNSEGAAAEVAPKEEPVKEINPSEFDTIEKGTLYALPIYEIQDGKGLVPFREYGQNQLVLHIQFVRGSKIGEGIEKKEGVLHEALVAMMYEDLTYKNGLVPSGEGSAILVHLEHIMKLQKQRADNRKAAGTQGTYQK